MFLEKKVCKQCEVEKELSEFYTQKIITKKSGERIQHNSYCKECTKENAEKWRSKPENREKWLQINKNKNKQPKYKKMIKEAAKKQRESGYYKNYQQENKDKFYKYGKTRRMNKEHDIFDQEWFECLDFFNNSCAYCGISEGKAFEIYNQLLHREHVDHNGANDITNCVPACKSCNGLKNTFELNDWYNQDNPLYNSRRYNRIIKWLLSFAEKVSSN